MRWQLKLLTYPALIVLPAILAWGVVDWIWRVVLAGQRDASRSALRSRSDVSTRKDVSG